MTKLSRFQTAFIFAYVFGVGGAFILPPIFVLKNVPPMEWIPVLILVWIVGFLIGLLNYDRKK